MRQLKFRYVFRNKNTGKLLKLIYELGINGPLDGVFLDLKVWELISKDQFINRHDKNGTEVYEHDLLATSNSDPKYDTWDKDEFGVTEVIWSDEYLDFTGSEWKWETDYENSVYSLKHFVEVVGTSHEQAAQFELK